MTELPILPFIIKNKHTSSVETHQYKCTIDASFERRDLFMVSVLGWVKGASAMVHTAGLMIAIEKCLDIEMTGNCQTFVKIFVLCPAVIISPGTVSFPSMTPSWTTMGEGWPPALQTRL